MVAVAVGANALAGHNIVLPFARGPCETVLAVGAAFSIGGHAVVGSAADAIDTVSRVVGF